MKCDYVRIGDAAAIVCGSRRRKGLKVCSGCRMLTARKQCDWKLEQERSDGKVGTCDEWICDACALEVGPDKHLCPTHAEAWAEHPKNPARARATTEEPEGHTPCNSNSK